jgi:hypothetical protein
VGFFRGFGLLGQKGERVIGRHDRGLNPLSILQHLGGGDISLLGVCDLSAMWTASTRNLFLSLENSLLFQWGFFAGLACSGKKENGSSVDMNKSASHQHQEIADFLSSRAPESAPTPPAIDSRHRAATVCGGMCLESIAGGVGADSGARELKKSAIS